MAGAAMLINLLGIYKDDSLSFKHLNSEHTWVLVTQDITKLATGVDLMNWVGLPSQFSILFARF